MIVILFGVSGSGKTVIGSTVAQKLGWEFIDADDLHSEVNRSKMRSGTPLTDEDRLPWLEQLRRLVHTAKPNRNLVVAFSGLKKTYRDFVRGGKSDVVLIFLSASFETIDERIRARAHAYMPPSLLSSQFSTLERPDDSEDAFVVSVEGSLGDSVDEVLAVVRETV